MNKSILIFLFLLVSIINIHSQQKEEKILLNNEFHLSYGFGSIQQLTNVTSVTFLGNSEEQTTRNTIGPIIFGYKRNFGLNLSFGIEYSYTCFESYYLYNNVINSKSFRYFHLLMLNSNYIYITNKWVQMYSGINFGFIYCNNNLTYSIFKNPPFASGTVFAYQVNVFSLRAGNKYGGFFELGYGCNGIVNIGVSYKF